MTLSRFTTGLLSAALLFTACRRQPIAKTTSAVPGAPPTIDGQAAEWADSLRYDAESKLQYQILNDGRAVYVRLKVPGPSTQARLIRQGFTVWLDTTGRNQQQFGIHYPLGGMGGGPGSLPRPANPDPDGPPTDRQERLVQALAGMKEMELLHYKGSQEPTLTDTQSQLGVRAAAAFDAQGTLVYELLVPLRLLFHKVPALAAGRKAVVGVTFAGAKWTTPDGGSGGPGGGRMGGGGGMGGAGGMRGGGMRSGGGNMGGGMRGGGQRGGSMPQGGTPISLKTSVQLAKP